MLFENEREYLKIGMVKQLLKIGLLFQEQSRRAIGIGQRHRSGK